MTGTGPSDLSVASVILNAMPYPAALIAQDGTLVACTDEFATVLGASDLLGHGLTVLLSGPQKDGLLSHLRAGTPAAHSVHISGVDGALRLEVVGFDHPELNRLWVCTLSRDRDHEAELAQLTTKMQLAIDAAGIWLWEHDMATGAVHWDSRMRDIYGLCDEGKTDCRDVWEASLHPDDADAASAYARECVRNRSDFHREFRIKRPDGSVRWIKSIARFVPHMGAAGTSLGVNIDVTEDHLQRLALEHARNQLKHESRHDALTGLGNRRLLDETLQGFIARAAKGQRWAVLHLDLDYFKQINDEFGHAGVDAVLVHLAQILTSLVGDAGLVCRNGGDEFVILLQHSAQEDHLRDLCHAILNRVRAPFIVSGQTCTFGLSIGGAMCVGPDVDPGEVLLKADRAVYAAKSDGRGCFRLFKQGMEPAHRGDMSIRTRLRDALSEGQLSCLYQPQFDPLSGDLVGAEALVRWDCPDRGRIAPSRFIPAAQALGIVARIDEYILETVLAQQTHWHRQGVKYPNVSLNISAQRLTEAGFLDHLKDHVQPHHRVSFELLETAFWDAPKPDVMAALSGLRALGLPIELDDFGSGHASVVALQTLRPAKVKIDRQLVSRIDGRFSQVATIDALVSIAKLEDCDVVIEGIETQAQLDAVRGLGATALQGYLLGEPVDAAAFAQSIGRPQVSASASA